MSRDLVVYAIVVSVVIVVIVIAAFLLAVLGILMWVVALVRGQRTIAVNPVASDDPAADPNAAEEGSAIPTSSQIARTPSAAAPRRGIAVGVLAGMALLSVAFVLLIYWTRRYTTVALPLLLIAGVVIFLSALAGFVVIFVGYGLSDRTHALGLPDGSIRAIIALALILLFAILVVFLFIGLGGFGTDNVPNAAQIDVSKQLITTLSTLVVAISSFYFGSTTVRESRRRRREEPEEPTEHPQP